MKTGDKVIIIREPSGVFDSDEVGKIGIICTIEEYENGECEYEVDTGNGNKFWYISGEFLLYNDFWHKLDETPIEDKECLLLLRFHKKVFSKLTNVKSGKFYSSTDSGCSDGFPLRVDCYRLCSDLQCMGYSEFCPG